MPWGSAVQLTSQPSPLWADLSPSAQLLVNSRRCSATVQLATAGASIRRATPWLEPWPGECHTATRRPLVVSGVMVVTWWWWCWCWCCFDVYRTGNHLEWKCSLWQYTKIILTTCWLPLLTTYCTVPARSTCSSYDHSCLICDMPHMIINSYSFFWKLQACLSLCQGFIITSNTVGRY